jgi:hypothetical protein
LRICGECKRQTANQSNKRFHKLLCSGGTVTKLHKASAIVERKPASS